MSITKEMAKIAINKSLLKEYTTSDSSRVVYMNDNDEFQIQLFNPYTYTVGAVITINGTEMPGTLIIKPGERIWLERYLDTARKFKFSTYEVEDNDADVKAAIAKNGIVEIRFYKERERVRRPIQIVQTNPFICYDDYKVTTALNAKSLGDNILRGCCDTVVNSAVSSATETAATFATMDCCEKSLSLGLGDDAGNARCATASAKSSYNGNQNVTCCVNSLNDNEITTIKEYAEAQPSTIETGRVTEGSYSDQKFNEVYLDLESWPCQTETIKILPMSRKPYTSSDVQKVYCVECGRKLNPKHKFCPYCGTKVE